MEFFNYKIEIEKAIDRIANGKVIRWDYIPGEMFKLKYNTVLLKVRLQDHFKNYVMTGDVPEYFMNARLILLSKDDSDTPQINKARPISILPTITKLFETTILHNFESVIQSQIFSKWQRGFTKGSSTIHNIEDILKYARELQLTKKIWAASTATVVFFDFKKAYDNVPRDLLIEKLQQMNIPCNITNLIY